MIFWHKIDLKYFLFKTKFKQASIFEILLNIHSVDLQLNSGIKTKLENFTNMIRSFQIEARSKNAFEVADIVIKQTTTNVVSRLILMRRQKFPFDVSEMSSFITHLT